MTRHRLIYVPSVSSPAITIGRSRTVYTSGAGGNFSIGWPSGGAAASGTWLVAIISEATSATAPLISGGSAWTRLGSTKCYYKQCGASEPTTYTVQYVGTTKSDATSVSIIEVIGASAVDATASATSTSSAPSVTTTSATDAIVLAVGHNTGSTPSPPSGYTLGSTTTMTNISTGLASKLNVGLGSIAPGNWGSSFTALHTIAFKV